PLPRRTPHTLTEPEAVMAELARVRAEGYAVIDQEVEIGLRSIAVPLVTARRVIVAAVNLGLPARSEPIEELAARYLPALQTVSSRMQEILR
ncbi:MAG: IclR family transcriptional regulator, partial [Mesorhizobium sp.]